MPIEIRPAELEDVDAIVAVVNDAYQDAHYFKNPDAFDRTNAAEVRDFLSSEISQDPAERRRTFYCVWDDSELAACVQFDGDYSDQETYFGMLSVKSSHQGRGHAKRLLHKIECRTAELGKTTLTCAVVSIQGHLMRMYSSKGFKIIDCSEWPVDSKPFVVRSDYFELVKFVNMKKAIAA
ncbi:acyl-CoA N-acyltransferase [Polychytrium aggregatum]|uniref:acyl-CoA N-acyltransferase n=1 Tax=Polychytrium aggregatum TaxID=110093 RepID=UPI0022FDB2F0|nr:acyl-CoA N-acyltransferase [Polychytrium aggregatum]KAI9204352.1 acyl-CoA N-acyltransferase [Polychytrium aggregatum]